MLSLLWKIVSRKLAVILLIAVSAITAFATLGDGRMRASSAPRSLLSARTTVQSGFSLRSGYNFRGSQVINTQSERYIDFNTVVTCQKGRTTYILPLKKKILLNKITFNPNASTRSY